MRCRQFLVIMLMMFGGRVVIGNYCSVGNCSFPPDETDNKTRHYRSPFYLYENGGDINCSRRMAESLNSTYIQMTIETSNLSCLKSYMKITGPSSFIVMYDDGKVSITGYPKPNTTGFPERNITRIIESDEDSANIKITMTEISDECLLEQYNQSLKKSAIQIMNGPLIFSSTEHKSNMVFLNVKNDDISGYTDCSKRAMCSGVFECKHNTLYCNNREETGCECKEGYRGIPEVGCKAYCSAGYLKNFSFPKTNEFMASYSSNPCDEGKGMRALALCERNPAGILGLRFQSTVSCKENVSSILDDQKVIDYTNVSSVTKISQELELVTLRHITDTDDLNKVAEYMKNLSNQASNVQYPVKILGSIVRITDNLISKESLTPKNGSNEEVKAKVLTSLIGLAEQVELPKNVTNFTIETPSTTSMLVDKKDNESHEWQAIVGRKTDNATEYSTINPVNVLIPKRAIEKAKQNSSEIRICHILHMTSTLFTAKDAAPNLVLTISLGKNKSIGELASDESIKIEFNNRSMDEEQGKFYNTIPVIKCVHWNELTNEWSPKRAPVKSEKKHNPVVCKHKSFYKHKSFASFAALFIPHKLRNNIPLAIYSQVGLILSISGLVLTIIVHALKEDVRKRRPTYILFNICFTLLVANILFVTVINKTESKWTCNVVTSVAHFFWLASWCWMSIYSYDMYRSLVLVFGRGISRFMTKCALFGYGIPFLISSLNIALAIFVVDPDETIITNTSNDSYNLIQSVYRPNHMCWIHKNSLYIGFLGPVGLMLIFNMYVYGKVMKTLAQREEKVESTSKSLSIKDQIFISVTLISSTGIAWLFGYFMLISDDDDYLLAMGWIFTAVNTLQGMIIFLSTCVRNETMRNVWLDPIRTCFSSFGTKISSLSSITLKDTIPLSNNSKEVSAETSM